MAFLYLILVLGFLFQFSIFVISAHDMKLVIPTYFLSAHNNSGLARGGAVVRNEWGMVVLASYFFYGSCWNIITEFRALCDGLLLVQNSGLCDYGFLIESDSLVLVNSVLGVYEVGDCYEYVGLGAYFC